MHDRAHDRPPEAIIRQLSELPSGDNRRKHLRYAVELDVSISSEHNFYAGFAQNLSQGGVFVATHSLKAAGTVIELSIFLPGTEHALRVRGEVCWQREYREGSDVSPGIGVRFLDLGGDAVERIQGFLRHREPLFYDDE